MASPIRVTLEIDNKKYISELKDAETATKKFGSTAKTELSATEQKFAKLNTSFDSVGKKLGGLKTAIAAVGFAALTRSAFEFAGQMDDVANNTGLAIDKILQLNDAFVAGGGSPEKFIDATVRFQQALEDAGANAGKSLYNFEKLGISLRDIGNKDTEANLRAALEGLVRMGPGAEQTALKIDLFGKSFRNVNPQEMLARLNSTVAGLSQYGENLQRADAASKKLTEAQQKLGTALLVAFDPIIQKVTEFTDKILSSQAAMDNLITTVKAVASVIVAAFSIGILTAFVATLGTLLRGLSAIKVAAGLGALPASIIAASGAAARLLPALRAISILIGTGLGIYTATQLFDSFGDIATNAVSRVSESVNRLGGDLLNLPTDLIGKLFGIKDPAGLGSPLIALAERTRRAREETERLAQEAKKTKAALEARTNFAQTDPRRVDQKAAGVSTEGADLVIQQKVSEIKKIGEAYDENNKKIRDRIELEIRLSGQSEAAKEVERARADAQERTAAAVKQLEEKRASLGKEDQKYIALIDEEIQLLKYRGEAENNAAASAASRFQSVLQFQRVQVLAAKEVNDLEDLRAQLLGYSLTAQEKLNQAKRDPEFVNKTEQEVKMMERLAKEIDSVTATLTVQNIQRSLSGRLMEVEASIMGRVITEVEKLNMAKAASPEAFARKTEAEVKALYDVAQAVDTATVKFTNQRTELERLVTLYDQAQERQRSLGEALRNGLGQTAQVGRERELIGLGGLERQFKEIEQRAQEAARSAQAAFADQFNNEDGLTAERAQELAAGLEQITKVYGGLGEAQKVNLELSRKFATGFTESIADFVSAAQNGADQAKTYFTTFTRGAEDAFVRFVQTGKLSFKDLANSLIADFARIQAKKALAGIFDMAGGGGGILGSIGKIFGFANGGNPGIGKPILVGERGPELMIPRNASTIVPNGSFGGGVQNTQVTYNIQAVDAASFQQLVARDPKFLHAVVEKGRRSMPQGVRQ